MGKTVTADGVVNETAAAKVSSGSGKPSNGVGAGPSTAPVSEHVMLGLGPRIKLGGVMVSVLPLVVKRKRRLDTCLEKLGAGYVNMAIFSDNPSSMDNISSAAESQGVSIPELTGADIRMSLRAMMLALTEDQIDAMYEICDLFLNGTTADGIVQSFDRDQLEEMVPLTSFPKIFCKFLDSSSLNP